MPRTLDKLLARIRALPPRGVDAGLGLITLTQGLIGVFVSDGASGDQAVAIAVVVVIALAVWLRRRGPVVAAMAALLGLLVVSAFLPTELADATSGAFLAVVFCVFWMGLETEGRPVIVAVVAGIALTELSVWVDSYDDSSGDLVIAPIIIVIAPVLIGQMLRGRGKLTAALSEKRHLAERERDRRAEEAVADERIRIAGDLHDVVAHALGAMTIQASAARRLVATDPPRAVAAFSAVESTGREALTELRALLGVLRREDEEIALAPQPRLANVRDLVRRTRAAGLPVELAIDGEAPADLAAGIDLTAYRVVQEALGAALASGAAGSATVRLRYGAGDVEVEVADDGTTEAPRRLLGMQERVRVYGGSLQAGPDRAGGGHRVRARLPLEVTS